MVTDQRPDGLGDPDEPEPMFEAPRTCTFPGCDQLATIHFGRAKSPNRCEAHGPGPSHKRKVDGEAPRPKAGGKVTPLRTQLLGTISLVGTVVFTIDPYDGQVILGRAEQVATALDHLAQQNPAVKRALLALTTGSSWGELVLAVAPIVLAIAAHHGLVPERLGAIAQAI